MNGVGRIQFGFGRILNCVGSVSYTEGWVCDVALIEYTLGSGETQEGLGIWKGGYKGPMGDKGN